MGTAVMLLLGNGLFMNWYYHRRIGLDMLAFWREIIRFIPASLVAVLLGWGYSVLVPVRSWLLLMISVVVYTMVYAAIMWLLGMNEYEKKLVRKMLRKLPGVK